MLKEIALCLALVASRSLAQDDLVYGDCVVRNNTCSISTNFPQTFLL